MLFHLNMEQGMSISQRNSMFSPWCLKFYEVLIAQLCLTLCNPIDCSPLGSSVHGVFQARILEWVAISFSMGIFLTQGSNPGLLRSRQTLCSLSSVQFSSVAQSCPTLFDPMNCSMPSLPVYHHLLEFTLTHVYRVSDAIQPSHPLSFPSPLAPNPSHHQSLFQWVNSSHEVAKPL